MLLKCCSIHKTIIIPRHILHLVHLCPCSGLGIFMSYLCDLFFIFSLIFIVINHITSFKQTYLFFAPFLEYFLLFFIISWIKKANNFQIAIVRPQLLSFCLIFCQFQPGVVYKRVVYKKKRVIHKKAKRN